jgi:hypothetical protein
MLLRKRRMVHLPAVVVAGVEPLERAAALLVTWLNSGNKEAGTWRL